MSSSARAGRGWAAVGVVAFGLNWLPRSHATPEPTPAPATPSPSPAPTLYNYFDDYVAPTVDGPIFPNCNKTKYVKWYTRDLDEEFSAVANFPGIWSVESIAFEDSVVTLTNGQALDKLAQFCDTAIETLLQDLAGRHGDVEEQYVYQAMCSDYCAKSDEMHQRALELSQCGCHNLSSAYIWKTKTNKGDWCRRNSARRLCKHLGGEYCGDWGCKERDFMCPRYEFDQKTYFVYEPSGGAAYRKGDCSSATARSASWVVLAASLLLSLLVTWPPH